MPPKVSILVPSYNHARFLRATLESVLAQTFGDWELILLDDCSPDDSVVVARQIQDPRVQIRVNDANLGTYGTQQKALERATGEYVAILNSDDLWEPTKLAKQVQALDDCPECSFCYVLGWKIDAEGAIDRADDVHANWPRAQKQDLLPFLLSENRVLASGALFRRQGLRFDPSLRYSGDWVALLEAALRGPCACVPERLTFWRMHGRNTFTASQPQLIEETRVRRSIAMFPDWFVARSDAKAVREGLGRNALNLLALANLFLDSSLTRRHAFEAVRLHPERPIALKRACAALVAPGRLRAHLWGGKIDFASLDLRSARRTVRENPPVAFSR